MGIMGGAIATLVSYVSMAVYIYYIVQKYYPVDYELSRIFGVLVVDICAIAVFYSTFGSLGIIYKVILSVVLCSFVIYISQLFKVKKLLTRS